MPADPARRSQESWRAILDAAFALLEDGGYQAITMGGIAARAGVGRQTLYRWWPSKAAVVFEAFLDKVSIGPFPEADGDFPSRLRGFAHGFVTLYVDGPAGRRLRELIGAAQTDPDLARALAEQWFEPRRAPVRQALRDAQQPGWCAPTSTRTRHWTSSSPRCTTGCWSRVNPWTPPTSTPSSTSASSHSLPERRPSAHRFMIGTEPVRARRPRPPPLRADFPHTGDAADA